MVSNTTQVIALAAAAVGLAAGAVTSIYREHFWNIPESVHLLPYGLLIAVGVIILWRLYWCYRLVVKASSKNKVRVERITERLKGFVAYAVGQRKIIRKPYPGLMHLGMFWGIIILIAGSVLVSAEIDFLMPIFHTRYLVDGVYLVFKTVLDVFGLLLIMGVVLALYRRFILKPESLETRVEDIVVLILLLSIALTGYIVEGLRLASTSPVWQTWSPFGYVFAAAFSAAGLGAEVERLLHFPLWLIHVTLSFTVLALAPYTKLFHILTAPLNIFFRLLTPRGALRYIDLEKEETIGAGDIRHFTWKDHLDLFACTECGRCQDHCPAYLSKNPLNPKKVILDLKHNLLLNRKTVTDGPDRLLPVIGDGDGYVSEEVIWACTTCAACVDQCPIFIEQFPKLIEMRRYLVLTEGRVPTETARIFRNLEFHGNPSGLASNKRSDWAKHLDIEVSQEQSDILLFVGCAGSYDGRNNMVVAALSRLLKMSGISFTILGNDEACCGDPARRLGNEYIFQMLAKRNIERFNRLNAKKIITICPHCYNTMKNEYPQFGAKYEVWHHSEFITSLLRNGKLKLTKKLDQDLTYHDSCYLGRHNGIYDQPREILKSIQGLRLFEMKRNRSESFCCGGGGGRIWLEQNTGEKINVNRTEQALNLGIDLIATACPYCLTMFEDGLKTKEREKTVQALDISELVEKAM